MILWNYRGVRSFGLDKASDKGKGCRTAFNANKWVNDVITCSPPSVLLSCIEGADYIVTFSMMFTVQSATPSLSQN